VAKATQAQKTEAEVRKIQGYTRKSEESKARSIAKVRSTQQKKEADLAAKMTDMLADIEETADRRINEAVVARHGTDIVIPIVADRFREDQYVAAVVDLRTGLADRQALVLDRDPMELTAVALSSRKEAPVVAPGGKPVAVNP
jgi:hypothetical protein